MSERRLVKSLASLGSCTIQRAELPFRDETKRHPLSLLILPPSHLDPRVPSPSAPLWQGFSCEEHLFLEQTSIRRAANVRTRRLIGGTAVLDAVMPGTA